MAAHAVTTERPLMITEPRIHGPIQIAVGSIANASVLAMVEPMPNSTSPTTSAHASFQVESNPPQ